MLSPDCFFHDASERQSEVWRKSGGDSETKPIHMHTHIRILSPPPKHSLGPVAPSTSWIPPAILRASVWACIHWKEREDAHLDPTHRLRVFKSMQVQIVVHGGLIFPRDHLNDQMQMWDKEAPARVRLTGLSYNPLAHNKTTEGGMSSRWQSPLSLLNPAYCINEDEVWSITS